MCLNLPSPAFSADINSIGKIASELLLKLKEQNYKDTKI